MARLTQGCASFALSALLSLGLVSPSAAQPARAPSWEEQVGELRLTLERSPSDHKTRFLLTKILIKLKRLEEALTTVEPLTSLSSPPEALELTSTFYQAYLLRELKRYDEALRAYKVVVDQSQSPNLAHDALFGLAKALELKGDPTGASEAYQAYIKRESRPKKAKWVESAKRSVRRLSAAVAPIEKSAHELESEEGAASAAERGERAMGLKSVTAQTTSARPASQERAQPASKEPQGAAASVNPDAERDPKASQGASPAQSSASIAQADQLFATGKYKEAAEQYRALSRGNLPGGDTKANLLHRASVSAFLAQEYRDAQIDAEEGLASAPQSEALRRTLKGLAVMSVLKAPAHKATRSDARLALREGRFEDALRLVAALEAVEGADADLERYKGKALIGLGRDKEGLKSLQSAERSGQHPHLSLELGQAAERAGEPKLAVKAYRAVLRGLSPQQKAHAELASLASEGLARLGAQD